MNVVLSTSDVQLSWIWTHYLELDASASALWCSADRTLSGRVVSPASLQFLLFHHFVSERHSTFVNYVLHYLFQAFASLRH